MVMCTFGTGKATTLNHWPSRWALPLCQWIQQRCSPKPLPMHVNLHLQNRSQSHSSSRSSLTASRASARTHSCNSCYRTPHDPYWINAEDLTLEDTLHNISINPSNIDGPADGEIFESNHLAEITDIQSKLIQNLVKVGKTYHHLCAQLLNLSPEELENFLANHEKDFDSHVCTTSST